MRLSFHFFIHSFIHSFIRCIYQHSATTYFSMSPTLTHLHGSANKNSSWIASRQPVL